MQFNKSHVFVLLFILLAIIATYISFNTIPHSVVLHINDRWHVTLVGETRINQLNYHRNDFVTQTSDTGNLWLNGNGEIRWQQHQLYVQTSGLNINGQVITVSDAHSQAHLMLYPDGRISKGKLVINN